MSIQLYKEKLKHFSSLQDQWGGIDAHILPLVAALNAAGFETLASCEGHIEKGHPVPRIVIRTVPEAAQKGTRAEIKKETLYKLHALIRAFYRTRKKTPLSICLKQERDFDKIILMNGEEHYKRNLRRIARLNAKHNKGIHTNNTLSEKEISIRKDITPKLQAEMQQFAAFLVQHAEEI